MPRLSFFWMRSRITFLVTALFCALAPAVVHAEIEFAGVLITSQQTRFVLRDTVTDRSEWTELGKTFAGFTLATYEAATDTLVLRRDADRTEKRLRLKPEAKIKDAAFELAGTLSLGEGEKLEIRRASLAYDQESVFPLKNGLTWRITPRRLPDGNVLYLMAIERLDPANGRNEQLSAPGVIAKPGKEFSIQLDDMRFAFKPSAN